MTNAKFKKSLRVMLFMATIAIFTVNCDLSENHAHGKEKKKEEKEQKRDLKEHNTDKPLGTFENMFFDITESNNSFTEQESFKIYFENLKSYLNENTEIKLILISYNDDTELAKKITRKVKSTLLRMGLTDTVITRKTGNVVDSPNGIAGVNIQIQ